MTRHSVWIVSAIIVAALHVARADHGTAEGYSTSDMLAPIVAEVVAEPYAYVDRHVKIHGMVTVPETASFELQDVSQMALRVRHDGSVELQEHIAVSVFGRIDLIENEPVLVADAIEVNNEKVLGGPCGCSSHVRPSDD